MISACDNEAGYKVVYARGTNLENSAKTLYIREYAVTPNGDIIGNILYSENICGEKVTYNAKTLQEDIETPEKLYTTYCFYPRSIRNN